MPESQVEKRPQFESGMLLGTFLLLGIGLVMVYSATVYLATTPQVIEKTQGNGMFFLQRQFFFVVTGLFAMALATFVPFSWFRKVALGSLVVGLIAMIGVLIFGQERLGAIRWYEVFGVSIQPGEYVKLAFILWVSHSLASKKEKVTRFAFGVLPHLCVAGVLVGLYMLQPDLGSCIILGSIMMILLYVAGTQKRHMLGVSVAGIAFVGTVILVSEEKRRRILAWLAPEKFAKEDGFQLINSKVSIGSGGWFGSGLGSGKQNISGYVPEAETDFIFSVLAEETGFIGCLIVIACFLYLFWRGMRLAATIKDHFSRYLTFGATLLVVLQAGINLGVNCGVLPTKGLTLPFISMGGSSMVVMCVCIGILLNTSRTHPRFTRVEEENEAARPAGATVIVKEG
jgi:cell division protein FtsW